jgi:hypothetical protein
LPDIIGTRSGSSWVWPVSILRAEDPARISHEVGQLLGVRVLWRVRQLGLQAYERKNDSQKSGPDAKGVFLAFAIEAMLACWSFSAFIRG